MENTVVSDKSPLVEESTPKMTDNGEESFKSTFNNCFLLTR